MTDRRKKNADWALNLDADGVATTSNATLAVLMDIRDELQTLNRTMSCSRVIDMVAATIRMEKRLERNYRMALKVRKTKAANR